jgi:hypothetical protein
MHFNALETFILHESLIICIIFSKLAPDDVLAIDEKTFYVTNVYHYRMDQSALLYNFETFTKRPWTDVLLCSKTDEWKCSIVISCVVLEVWRKCLIYSG